MDSTYCIALIDCRNGDAMNTDGDKFQAKLLAPDTVQLLEIRARVDAINTSCSASTAAA